MDREPDRRAVRRGPGDAMTTMRRQVDEVAGPELDDPALELEPRRADEQHDPLALLLVVPGPGRRGLAMRDDALDAAAWTRQQLGEDLAGGGIGQVAQQVRHPAYGLKLTA